MKRLFWGLLVGLAVLYGAAQLNDLYSFETPIKPHLVTTSVPSGTEPTGVTNGSSEEAVFVSELPDYGPAPELSNESWLNVDHPLRLADLRGKVVLIDMWTFG